MLQWTVAFLPREGFVRVQIKLLGGYGFAGRGKSC